MIAATEFKAKCLSLLDRVEKTGEELVISKHGKPVAKLVPVTSDREWKRLLGSGKFIGDPFAPVVDDAEIEALK